MIIQEKKQNNNNLIHFSWEKLLNSYTSEICLTQL